MHTSFVSPPLPTAAPHNDTGHTDTLLHSSYSTCNLPIHALPPGSLVNCGPLASFTPFSETQFNSKSLCSSAPRGTPPVSSSCLCSRYFLSFFYILFSLEIVGVDISMVDDCAHGHSAIEAGIGPALARPFTARSYTRIRVCCI